MVAAVVLAAGASSRYGGIKQLELLPAVLAALRKARGIGDVVVVEGAHPLEAAGARVVRCDDWARGPGASLRAALAALGPEVTHALVVLADGPALDPRAVERLAARRHDAPVLAASYDGTRSHPVVLARAAWSEIPDEGARALEAVLVDTSDLRPPGDIDVRR
ncbi:MAG TPA: NTP transferase domain-containing protein [Gaiellaceae bacterium]|nr:NTP transferase domain-containing protein [Gaiellaceae bacterium]